MDRRILFFIALAASMLYGAGFAAFDFEGNAYAVVGGVVCALLWIAVGVFGKNKQPVN